MLPYSIIGGGSFTSDSSLAKQVALNDRPDLFWLRNRTAWGDDAAETSVESWWRYGMAGGSAQTADQAVTTGILSTEAVTTGGFTFIDTANPPTFAGLATTNIAGNTGTFVVTMANTGSISVGDWVQLYGTTGELQIAGYTFQVTAVTANVSITLGYMASAVSSGGLATFAAAATAGTVVKYIPNRMYPRWSYIAMITQATQGVVYFTGKNDYTPGEIISFRVPSQFGMEQMNNVQARVLSVTNSSTVSSVTIDYDTSGFSTFAFPLSATAAAGVSPAVVVPSSSGVVPDNGSASIPQIPEGYNLRDAFDNRNKFIMDMGSNVITSSSAIYDWVAFKYDAFSQE
jgi:hypothetical protein